jgi:hypothetical protein
VSASGGGRPTIVVVVGGAEHDPWRLPASEATQRTWVHGGERTMYELSVAAAGLGYEVELRGLYSTRELAEVCRAGGATPLLGLEPRRPVATDLVVLPEGSPSAFFYTRVALSPARAIVYLLAAPGLFGPGIIPDFRDRAPLEVTPEDVGRPQDYRALRDSGFELWTNAPVMAEESVAAGVPCAFTGTGQPIPYLEPGERAVDAAFVSDNRWVELSRRVADMLRCSVLEIPKAPRGDVVRAMASARVLFHPPIIEGQSRIQLEARAVGTVPVSLRSNRYVSGFEEGGGILVDSVEDMAVEVERLLGEPEELARRSRVASSTVREQTDWPRYVQTVERLLEAPAPDDELRPVRARMGEAIETAFDEVRERRGQVAGLERAVAWLEGLRAEGEDRGREVAWLREVVARTSGEREEAVARADALSRRRSVRLADALGRIAGRRPRGTGRG